MSRSPAAVENPAVSFNSTVLLFAEKKTFKSARQLFGEEYCYVMDAKSMGNLGRYLNVSTQQTKHMGLHVLILSASKC